MNYKTAATIFFIVFFSVTFYAQTTQPKSLKTLESREINLRGCIQTYFKKEFVIKNDADFLKEIRNDASRKFCLEKVVEIEKIDFSKNSLLGMEIRSDYCRRPDGLKAVVSDDIENKQFIVEISYWKPEGICRAVGQYDLWLLVPKNADNYKVTFEIKPEEF